MKKYEVYLRKVKRKNRKEMEGLKNLIKERGIAEVCKGVLITGSWGRLEGWGNREKEGVILYPREKIPSLHPVVPVFFIEKDNSHHIFPLSENRHMYAPQIIWDSYPLFLEGDIRELREKVVEEVKKTRRKTRAYVKRKLQEYLKVMDEGKNLFRNKERIHYDMEEGIAYYDGKVSFSFKYGPLRGLQFSIVLFLVDEIRENERRVSAICREMPRQIPYRLERIAEEYKYPHSLIEELGEIYTFFLRAYHRSIHFYESQGVVGMPFDIKEVKERIEGEKGILKETLLKRYADRF